MKYKPRDKVVVATKEVLKKYYNSNLGFCTVDNMFLLANSIVTIDRYYDDEGLYQYYIKEDGGRYLWRDEFFSHKYPIQLELF